MTRLLIVPAAGSILTRVSGRPRLDHLERLYRRAAGQAVLVAPKAAADAIRARLAAFGLSAAVIDQPEPASLVDQILLAAPGVLASGADRIWITWCDRVAIGPGTITRLRELEERDPDAEAIVPILEEHADGIERDETGRLSGLPPDATAGLFSLSRRAYLEDLRWYAPEATDFLPFFHGRRVATFAATPVADVSPRVSIVANGRGLRDRVIRSGADLILLHEEDVRFRSEDQDTLIRALMDAQADLVVGGGPLMLCPRTLLLNMDLEGESAGLARAIERRALRVGMTIARVEVLAARAAETARRANPVMAWLQRLGLGRRRGAALGASKGVEQSAGKVADDAKRDEQD